jgi:DNA invertase Pin-like site-specific DNA recombinase
MTPRDGRPPLALIYTRVSKDEQAREGVSLAAQLATCRRYAAAHGWLLGEEFQDVLSGRRDDRPRYQDLLTEVRRLRTEGYPVVVAVARLDRLGRRLLERVRSRQELQVLGVPVHSVSEGGEVSDLVANVLAAVAEEEVRALGERVVAARRHIAAGGWYLPGKAPWGYRWRPATTEERHQGAPRSVLEIDPETAPHDAEAFARAAAGATICAVHEWLVTLPATARGGRVMGFAAVRQILASPVYAARPPRSGSDILAQPVGRWPAIVDDDTWLRVRDHVRSHRNLPRQASRTHLLTGLLRCPRCGGRMHGRRQGARTRDYECMANLRGANVATRTCTYSALAPQVDNLVLAEVLPTVEIATEVLPSLRTALTQAWEALRRPIGNTVSLAAQRTAQLERTAEQARSRLTKAAVLFADGDLDHPGYELLRDKARADLEAAEAELGSLRAISPDPDLPPLQTVLGAAGGWVTALREGDVPAQREVLAVLVDHVVPVRVRRGEYAVEIAWTPLGQALRELCLTTADTVAALSLRHRRAPASAPRLLDDAPGAAAIRHAGTHPPDRPSLQRSPASRPRGGDRRRRDRVRWSEGVGASRRRSAPVTFQHRGHDRLGGGFQSLATARRDVGRPQAHHVASIRQRQQTEWRQLC